MSDHYEIEHPMFLLEQHPETNKEKHHGRFSALVVASWCFLRRVLLFFSATPKTPLRVLCIIAFDTIHVLRSSKQLSPSRIKLLAALLDFGACANAALDNKPFSSEEYQATLSQLRDAGFTTSIDKYLRRLQDLERGRPALGGAPCNFGTVRSYREAVVQLSLGIVAELALGTDCFQAGSDLNHRDYDLETVFRIVMQCQVIDDVLDYTRDAAAGLPSFLTGSVSVPQALKLTAQASRKYALKRDLPCTPEMFPFRLAQLAVSVVAKLLVRLRYWQHRMVWAEQFDEAEGLRSIS